MPSPAPTAPDAAPPFLPYATPQSPRPPLPPWAINSIKWSLLFPLTPIPCLVAIAYAVAAWRQAQSPQDSRTRLAAAIGALLGILGLAAWVWAANTAIEIHRKIQMVQSQSNLREIGNALHVYASNNGGLFPNDLDDVVKAGFLKPALLSRPNTGPGAPTPYVYTARGLTTRKLGPNRVIAFQPPGRTTRHMLVLFADGHQQAIPETDAPTLLQKLFDELISPATQPAAAAPSSRTTIPPSTSPAR